MRKTGVYNDMILENMGYAVSQGIPLIARIPVIPKFNASLKDAAGMAENLCKLGIREVHLLPFHQFGEKKYEQLETEYEMSWRAAAASGAVAEVHPGIPGQGTGRQL